MWRKNKLSNHEKITGKRLNRLAILLYPAWKSILVSAGSLHWAKEASAGNTMSSRFEEVIHKIHSK